MSNSVTRSVTSNVTVANAHADYGGVHIIIKSELTPTEARALIPLIEAAAGEAEKFSAAAEGSGIGLVLGDFIDWLFGKSDAPADGN